MSRDCSQHRIHPQHWAVQAKTRADVIGHETRVAKAMQQFNDEQKAAENAIEVLLTSVCKATGRRRFAPVDQWRGISVERAYRSLHAADIFLVQLLSQDHLEAKIRSMIADARAIFESDDLRLREIYQLTGFEPSGARGDSWLSDPPVRADVQEAMRIYYSAYNQLHVRVRHFRNLLIVGAMFIAVLMGALVLVVTRNPDAMSFCFSPSNRSVCPSGEEKPSSRDVLIISGLGLVGGILAAVFSILKIRGTSTIPYQIPIATALLKIPSGALTAVVGIILLGGRFVPGLSELDNPRQIMAYALIFGYAQQLATRFVDDQAQSLHAGVPGEGRERR